MNPAVVLLSGGLDSATVAFFAASRGFRIYSISFDYGQRHRRELESARILSAAVGSASHLVIPADLTVIGGSALTSRQIEVPTGGETGGTESRGIPLTYVPARNTIFLSYALAWAEVLDAADIFIGVNAVDYSGYPDCRPEFIAAFEKMANLSTRASVEGGVRFRIHTPLINMTKAEIVKLAVELGLDFSLTWSCYNPDSEGSPCGRCDSCILRAKGFKEAGIPDPLLTASG